MPVGDVTADESVRRDTTVETLAALKPVFDPDGTTTAGNAPGVNDGASCVIVCSEEWAKRRGLEPLATIVSQGYVADDFAYLARTPANAAAIALAEGRQDDRRCAAGSRSTRRSRRSRGTRRSCSAPTRRSSTSTAAPSRSAIRSARPAAGSSRTLVHELRRSGGGLGLAAICSGGGQGDALLLEV